MSVRTDRRLRFFVYGNIFPLHSKLKWIRNQFTCVELPIAQLFHLKNKEFVALLVNC